MAIDKNFDRKFKTLPPYVQDWMAEHSSDINGRIAEKYKLSPAQTGKMVSIIADTIVGLIKLENFREKLRQSLPNLDEKTLNKLALDIIIERFYPIRDYLEEVEVLVEKLGGSVPKETPLYSETFRNQSPEMSQDSYNSQTEKEVIYENIPALLEKYPSIENQFITSKPIQLKGQENPVAATLANWVEDYKIRCGAPPHSGLERADYLFKSDNTKDLDNTERAILGGVLKAYDEGGVIPIDANSGKLILSEIFKQNPLNHNLANRISVGQKEVESDEEKRVSEQQPEEQSDKSMPENTIDLRK